LKTSKKRRVWPWLLVLLVILAGAGYGGWQFYQQQQTQPTAPKTTKVSQPKPKKKKQIKLVALGDSLTQGVGDKTDNGGYVGIIQKDLTQHQSLKVATQNYGVAGDTSTQIDTRLENQTKLQTNLAHADVIVMTVGGNDLMGVLKQNGLSVNEKNIQAARKIYRQHLTTLLKHVRHYNTKAPIFMFSIYNPFYVYFPKMTEMQDAVVDWNQTSQAVLQQQGNGYFVNICNLMSKGGKLTQQSKSKKSKNQLIFTGDNFHPNYIGYTKMTQKLYTSMMAHQKGWLIKS
jgi:lysophospholipase L1-like esterase